MSNDEQHYFISYLVLLAYATFWLKSIHTYCAEDTAVIVVATHSENTSIKVSVYKLSNVLIVCLKVKGYY
jgi:hypothetical protein